MFSTEHDESENCVHDICTHVLRACGNTVSHGDGANRVPVVPESRYSLNADNKRQDVTQLHHTHYALTDVRALA
eukprot:56525-Eustigmatos_ZCMA.PRE.2